MRSLAVVLVLVLSIACSAWGRTSASAAGGAEDPGRGFEQILDLWRDGRYSDLYERTISEGKESRESFASRLSGAARRPACCWEKLQEVRVTPKGDDRAVVRAKVGLESAGGTEFSTRSFKLVKDEGVWRVSRSDIFALAALKKKSARHRSKKKIADSWQN